MAITAEMFCTECGKITEWEPAEGFTEMLPMRFWKCKACGAKLFSPDGRKPRSRR